MRLSALLPGLFSLVAWGCSSSPAPSEFEVPPGEDEKVIEAPTELKSALPRELDPLVSSDQLAAAVTSTTTLGLELLRRVEPGRNFMVSPHSIMAALAMAEAGASDATKDEMRAAMQLGAASSESMYASLNRLDLDFALHAGRLIGRSSTRVGLPNPQLVPGKLNINNGVFQQRGLDVLPGYLDVLSVHFGAAVQQVDFERESSAATASVNSWIEARTAGAIAKFFAEPLDAETRLVLVNSVLFDGAWASPFNASITRDAAFASPAGTVQVPTMSLLASQSHAELEGAKLVELPFRGEGHNFAVDIVLPDGDLAAYEAALDAPRLSRVLAALVNDGGLVQLTMPKFRLAPSAPTSLQMVLQQLGMKLAFRRDAASFAAMTPDGKGIRGYPLFVSDVQQQVMFDLDETGVEASAASAVRIGEPGMARPEPAFEMIVDRPFLVVLRDTASGQILFLGRVTDPSAP